MIVRTVSVGTERAYPHESLSLLGPRVFADAGAAVLYIPAAGDDGRAGGGFYRLDFTTGSFRRLFSRDEGGRERSSVSALSADNKSLYLGVLTAPPTRWSSVVAVDLATGREQAVLALPDSSTRIQGMAMSPDGTALAMHAVDGRIVIGRITDGAVRELVGPAPGGGWPEVVRWSSDGRSIVYGRRSGPASTTWQLMRVPSSGGVSEPAGVDSSQLSTPVQLIGFDLGADDRRVALTVRAQPTFDVSAVNSLRSRFLRRR